MSCFYVQRGQGTKLHRLPVRQQLLKLTKHADGVARITKYLDRYDTLQLCKQISRTPAEVRQVILGASKFDVVDYNDIRLWGIEVEINLNNESLRRYFSTRHGQDHI